jgi:hypothetical protein
MGGLGLLLDFEGWIFFFVDEGLLWRVCMYI